MGRCPKPRIALLLSYALLHLLQAKKEPAIDRLYQQLIGLKTNTT
jgi:hypothetical protein